MIFNAFGVVSYGNSVCLLNIEKFVGILSISPPSPSLASTKLYNLAWFIKNTNGFSATS